MNKQTFLSQLELGLKKHQIHDIDDIISEYTYHFERQLENGKSEEDIASMLGDLNSIIEDYAEIGSKTRSKWFDLVAVGFIAVPLLILLYGVLITFFATTLASWGITVYYVLGLSSLSFMPYIPTGVHLLYALTALAMSFLCFSFSVYLFAQIKSMTRQYIVKQAIRIGQYHIRPIYKKICIYSLIIFILGFVIAYIVSAIVAKDFQYWHVWNWFE